jgi:hypothetical protein
MALTAEQVENVRAAREGLRGYRNFTGYARFHVNQLVAAIDALFPATEPAEDAKPCGSNSVTLGWCKLTARHEGLHTNGTYLWGTPSEPDPPTPAEPAEEETKAGEHRSVIHSNRTIKTVGEALSYAETALLSAYPDSGQRARYAEVIAELLRDVARQRPVGSNGKHGELHTSTCGCEAVTFSAPVVEEETKAETGLGADSLAYLEMSKALCDWIDADPRRSINGGTPSMLIGEAMSALGRAGMKIVTSSPVVPAPTEAEAGHA